MRTISFLSICSKGMKFYSDLNKTMFFWAILHNLNDSFYFDTIVLTKF